MSFRFIDSADVRTLLAYRQLTPEQEAEIVAQYIQEWLASDMDADYQDFETMVANGISAEEVLRELKKDLPSSE